MIRISIVNIIHEAGDTCFHLQYKVCNQPNAPQLRSLRATKKEIIEYVSIHNETSQEKALELFDRIITNYSMKAELFTSYLKYFHFI